MTAVMNFIVSVAVALSSILIFSWIYIPRGISEITFFERRAASEPTKYAMESQQLAGVDVNTWKNCSDVKFCSHRGRGSPFPEASEEAILFMLAQNVTCFDLDVIQSKDGVVFIGHPKSLASEKPVHDFFQLTSHELTSLFGDRLLSVDRFFSLLTAIPSDRRATISVTLEPKSSPDDLRILEALGTLIGRHGVQASVSVIVLDAAGGPSRGQGSAVALDKVLAAGVVPAVAVHDPQASIVPTPLQPPPSAVRTVLFAASALFHPLLFNVTGQVRQGRRVVVYGMEDPDKLPEGIARGASAFISDDPLRLRGRVGASVRCRPGHSVDEKLEMFKKKCGIVQCLVQTRLLQVLVLRIGAVGACAGCSFLADRSGDRKSFLKVTATPRIKSRTGASGDGPPRHGRSMMSRLLQATIRF